MDWTDSILQVGSPFPESSALCFFWKHMAAIR